MADDGDHGSSTPRASANIANDLQTTNNDDSQKNIKGKKRAFFGFGKKKSDATQVSSSTDSDKQTPSTTQNTLQSSASTLRTTTQPSQTDRKYPTPSSPARALSTSPRLSSPARSQIFERDVQDSTVLLPNSPAIPTHIQTENHIPPVLDDASEAITNRKLDPDAVEIVTHSSHQPASVTVTGAPPSSPPYDPNSSEWAAELASFADRVGLGGESASNYGSLESADVRRLSFISFADVVQSEHTPNTSSPHGRDIMPIAGLTSLSSAALNRSPSPIRSPVSSQGPGTSPPTSNPSSMKGVDMSPPRKPIGSPGSGQLSLAAPSDLNIETMRQALRRTGSTDLSHARSSPASPL